MKITICGSIAFLDQMMDYEARLREYGHEVFIPDFVAQDSAGTPMDAKEFYRIRKSGGMDPIWFEREKSRAIKEHFDKISISDAILVVNPEKNGIPGYIGGNTLMEMGVAFHLGKDIYILENLPEIAYREELIGMSPKILPQDLSTL